MRIVAALTSLLFAVTALGQQPGLPPQILDQFAVRSIGPANMGGRITAVAVVESKPSTMYVAAASGGVWKTVNQGVTWTPIFDDQAVASIGTVAVAPSDPDIVWVGTGESNARNSVSWGDGVYKSSDGGKTWKNMGLRDSQHIGKIVIHPKDPDIVYVAALGHVWGPNQERGLFVTRDGGKTWQTSKFLNEDTGFIDLALDPGNPDILYAAAYQVRRDAFSGGNPAVMTGPDAGLYKTSDAGKTWKRLTKGLPSRPIGRCGLAVANMDPRILYAVIQTDQTVLVRATELGQGAKRNDQPDNGGIFRSDDRGETWTKLNDLCPRPFYFSKIRVDPTDSRRVYVLGVTLHLSVDGGQTFARNQAPGVHADHHALWINPNNPDHMVLGNDGGLYFSFDRAENWEHVRNLPISQFYAIGLDVRKPYRVYGGLQDNGTWGGPSQTRNREGITLADWFRVLGADGFYCQADPTDPDTVYGEGQYGNLQRVNVRTGETVSIWPREERGGPTHRYNWSSPFLLSPHDPRTVYFGANYVFRSNNRGESWQTISPDLTRGGRGHRANMGHTLTALAESPLRQGLLYAGSDDGLVHVNRDGRGWFDISDRIPGVPQERTISRIECSPHAEETAYLSIDRHRNDDRAPYLFKTEDTGRNWKSITANLPAGGPVHVVRSDPRNPQLLFAGTEFGLFVSIDGGALWQKFGQGLPTVAVHDLAIHPRDRELVIATHGRGIYVVDISALQEMKPAVLASPAHLFEVKPATAFRYRAARGFGVGKNYLGANPEYGAALWIWLKEKTAGKPALTIADAVGNIVTELPVKNEAGLQRVQWPLAWGNRRDETLVAPGNYQAQLRVGTQVQRREVHVDAE